MIKLDSAKNFYQLLNVCAYWPEKAVSVNIDITDGHECTSCTV